MLREDTVFGPIFSRRLGSSLGHTIELKDEDLIVPGQTACHTWAVVCLVLAIPALAGAALPRRKDHSERENDG